MAPPTRHSSRLGGAALATLNKQDENAGTNLVSRQPAKHTLRGRKELLTASAATKTSAINSKLSGVSATNTRKRILDDRSNGANIVTSKLNQPTLKPASSKLAPVPRKPSTTLASRKPLTVIDDQKTIDAPAMRIIKPIKAEVTARSTATRKANSASAHSANLAGPSHKINGTTSKTSNTTATSRPRRITQRTIPRGAKVTGNGVEDEAYDAGHVSKKVRTSDPDEIQKENRAMKAIELKEELQKKDHVRIVSKAAQNGRAVASQGEMKATEQDWEDLDEGDEEDPLMVKEYVHEIYHYMRELELETLPDSDYMSRQNELTWKMRGVLVDWIIEVHSKFRLLPETLYLAINLMDRFLTKRSVALIKFQLVGVTALFLAAKYEEVICPSVTNFLYMTDGGYDCDEILKAETYMLEMLNWDLRYPNPLNFLRRVSKADNYDIQSRTFAKYFMEISIVDYRLVATPPSLLGATSLWLARKLLSRGPWNPNLTHYSGYTEAEIVPTAQIMMDYILRSGCKNLGMGLDPNFVGQASYEGGNEHGNLFKKYATRKFFRVSEIVRDWAVDRYTYETPLGYEWDKLEEWTSNKPTKKRVNSNAPSRQVAVQKPLQVYDDDEQEDEFDEDQDEVDNHDHDLMEHDDAVDDNVDDDEEDYQ